MPADLTTLRKPVKNYLIDIANGPIHYPRTFNLPPGETAVSETPDTVTFRPVPRFGPPLRACPIGGQLIFYGGDSYVRGGGAATGHTWKIYRFPTGLATDNNYVGNRNAGATDVTATMGTVLDLGKTLQFNPTLSGTYAIELRLTGTVDGDGVTAPLGFGVRFVKVPAAGATDWDGVTLFDGPSGSLDEGGVSARLSYQRPDNLFTRQTIDPNQRIAVNMRLSYGDPTGGLTEYTWQPSGTFDPAYYSSEVLLSGLVLGSDIREDARTHAVDFTVAGAQSALDLLQLPTVVPTSLQPDVIATGRYGLAYYESAVWPTVSKPRASEQVTIPGWTHLVGGLVASDVILHTLQAHTNLMDFFDMAIDQTATDTLLSVAPQMGGVRDWLQQFQAGRFGRLVSDRKSIVYCGPDDDLRDNAFRPAPVITLDGTLYKAIRVRRPQVTVGQVWVQSGETIQTVSVSTQVGAELEQWVRRVSYQAHHPATAGPGDLRKYEAAQFFNQTAINQLAQRIYRRDTASFPEIELDLDMFPHLDLNQPILIELDPWSQEAALEWNAAAGGAARRCYVTGYRNALNPAGGNWTTTLIAREATL